MRGGRGKKSLLGKTEKCLFKHGYKKTARTMWKKKTLKGL